MPCVSSQRRRSGHTIALQFACLLGGLCRVNGPKVQTPKPAAGQLTVPTNAWRTYEQLPACGSRLWALAGVERSVRHNGVNGASIARAPYGVRTVLRTYSARTRRSPLPLSARRAKQRPRRPLQLEPGSRAATRSATYSTDGRAEETSFAILRGRCRRGPPSPGTSYNIDQASASDGTTSGEVGCRPRG